MNFLSFFFNLIRKRKNQKFVDQIMNIKNNLDLCSPLETYFFMLFLFIPIRK